VQCREGDKELRRVLAWLDDGRTRQAVDAERTVLHALGGGCSVPVGATATEDDRGRLQLSAAIFALDDPSAVRVELHGTDAVALGEAAARRLVDLGGDRILASFGASHRIADTALLAAPEDIA
jgi:hydroxymethylbilane synthase